MTARGSCSSSALLLLWEDCSQRIISIVGWLRGTTFSFPFWGCFGGFPSSCSHQDRKMCSGVFLFVLVFGCFSFLKESLKQEWRWDLLSPPCTLTRANLSRYLSNKTNVSGSIRNTKRHSLKMNSSYPLSFSVSIWRCSLPSFYPAREEFSEPEMKKQPLRGL